MAYTTINDPSAHFQVAIYTGNASDRSITNTGNSNLKPDMVWIKPRNSTVDHVLQNSTTGVTKYFKPNKVDVEATASSIIQAFQTNGFSLPSGSSWNQNSQTNVAWQWKAGGGTTSSNSDGDITSTVQANTDAGFSIITYTASGTTNDTIGHGLGVEPDVAIFKRRDTGVSNWDVQHNAGNPGAVTVAYRHTLNLTEGTATNVLSSFSSSTIGLSTGGDVQKNASGSEYICFAFAAKQGYSAFGSYYGNASTNGEFVYLGFKPALVIFKVLSDPNHGWSMMDNTRSTFNLMDDNLFANANTAETTDQNACDFLSNGFKLRGSTYPANAGGTNTFAYFAWAENPFVTSGGVPATARALTG
jgi:hypothetical protein